VQRAEELRRDGELGLARVELAGAIAAADLPADDRERARRLHAELGDELARRHIHEATAMLDAGEHDEASRSIELALSLEPDARLRAEARALVDAIEGGAGSMELVVEAEPPRDRDEPLELPAEGDHEMGPVELALLVLDDDAAARLESLVAESSSLAAALAEVGGGNHAAALERFAEISGPVAAEPYVRREYGRAALAARDPTRAVELLTASSTDLPEDAEVLELLMEARLESGDQSGAADLADTLLTRGVGRDLGALLAVLSDAGRAEQALDRVDAMLATSAHNIGLQDVRVALLERADRTDDAVATAEQAYEQYRKQCRGCAGGQTPVPITSIRLLLGTARSDRAELLRILVVNDPRNAERWAEQLAGRESRL